MNVARYRRSRGRRSKTAWRPLAVAGPLVQREHPGEFVEVAHLVQLRLGQVVHHLAGHQAADEAAAELQAGCQRLRAGRARARRACRASCAISHSRHLDDVGGGDGESNGLGQARRDQLVGEHAQVLRIVLELDDPELAVCAQHQLALRAAAHSTNRLYCEDRQGVFLRSKELYANKAAPRMHGQTRI